MIAQAQSGTGKTATFAISILQQIELDLKATQALVLAPTRELAQQVGLPSPSLFSPSLSSAMLPSLFYIFFLSSLSFLFLSIPPSICCSPSPFSFFSLSRSFCFLPPFVFLLPSLSLFLPSLSFSFSPFRSLFLLSLPFLSVSFAQMSPLCQRALVRPGEGAGNAPGAESPAGWG